jgi:hypothetical protein
MNDPIKEIRERLSVLDCSQASIQKTSEEFVNFVKNDESVVEDLVKLWRHFCLNKSNKLAYLFLANDIIQNSFYHKLKIHDAFFNQIIEVFPQLYTSLNEKLRKEVVRVIDIWIERGIYDAGKLENLRQLLSFNTIPTLSNMDNPLFQNLFKNHRNKISDKIKELATNFENFENYKQNSNKIRGEGDSDALEVEKAEKLENKYRENLLKITADTVKKQNQIYFKHVYYLQELDKMLDKINTFKSLSEKSITNSNSNSNANLNNNDNMHID